MAGRSFHKQATYGSRRKLTSFVSPYWNRPSDSEPEPRNKAQKKPPATGSGTRLRLKPPAPPEPNMDATEGAHIVDLENEEMEAPPETPREDLANTSPEQMSHSSVNHLKYDTPFRFLDLEQGIRKRILRIVLKKPHVITPFYNQGSVEMPESYVTAPNIDISLLLVNRKTHLEAADALYSENEFLFIRPLVAFWWVRHIGISNLERIRAVCFILDAGDTLPFLIRAERSWHCLFVWLQSRHRFKEISISFERWTTAHFHWLDPVEQLPIRTHRDGTILALNEFRGLEHVEVWGGDYLPPRYMDLLARTMKLSPGQAPPEDDLENQ